jgi:hypothetical protein
VPQSGTYTTTYDAADADMPHEVTVIGGGRFPTCRHCKGVRFELAHAAKHVGEIDHLEEAHAPVSWALPALVPGMARPLIPRARAELPEWIAPQLTQLVDEAPDGPDWLHEIKFPAIAFMRVWTKARQSSSPAPGSTGPINIRRSPRRVGARRAPGISRRRAVWRLP